MDINKIINIINNLIEDCKTIRQTKSVKGQQDALMGIRSILISNLTEQQNLDINDIFNIINYHIDNCKTDLQNKFVHGQYEALMGLKNILLSNLAKKQNKDLIEFVDDILRRYNATPDEWDAFESVKYSMDTTHEIAACFYPNQNEVEATWTNITTRKTAVATFSVTPEQGKSISEVVMPCVIQNAVCLKL